MKTMPSNAKPAGKIAQHHHAGDDGRRRQHDADLERSGRHLVVVILGERVVALFLLLEGAPRQFDGAFALAAGGLGLRAIARRGLGPFVDLLGHRGLAWLLDGAGSVDLHLLARDQVRVRRMFLAWKKFQRLDASI